MQGIEKSKNLVPISQALRSEKKSSISQKNKLTSVKISLLDDEIAALEREIKNDEIDSSSGSDDEDDYEDHDGLRIKMDDRGNILKITSALSDEKIESLPGFMLPVAQCSRYHVLAKNFLDSEELKVDRPSTKRLKFFDESETSKSQEPPKKISGIEATVRELLKNYEPSSVEKRPFYCRVCKFQGQNLDEFNKHKLTEFHFVAVEVEKKISTCKVCRKEFNSPEQLKEHLKGLAHQSQMDYLKTKQISMKKFT